MTKQQDGLAVRAAYPRLPESGRYWLKRARVALADLRDGDLAGRLAGDGGADGTALVDIRIEEGRIRAVLPAGVAPCCSPGVWLDGRVVRPAGEGGLVAGACADLRIDWPGATQGQDSD
jgi:hypothetical protein